MGVNGVNDANNGVSGVNSEPPIVDNGLGSLDLMVHASPPNPDDLQISVQGSGDAAGTDGVSMEVNKNEDSKKSSISKLFGSNVFKGVCHTLGYGAIGAVVGFGVAGPLGAVFVGAVFAAVGTERFASQAKDKEKKEAAEAAESKEALKRSDASRKDEEKDDDEIDLAVDQLPTQPHIPPRTLDNASDNNVDHDNPPRLPPRPRHVPEPTDDTNPPSIPK